MQFLFNYYYTTQHLSQTIKAIALESEYNENER